LLGLGQSFVGKQNGSKAANPGHARASKQQDFHGSISHSGEYLGI
jgi:hypothetical protein